ncbi:hypothetical protein DF057_19445 [Burkholderia cepacia]|nr:hypothetical protein DF135_06520 [Burkholderia cepacia]RQZ59802.1 hypothetical protein DF057_19445 [Burkholderia cepacia]
MPAGAAHAPQGLHLCGPISTDTILYIHTVFHDDPEGGMGWRWGPGLQQGAIRTPGRPTRFSQAQPFRDDAFILPGPAIRVIRQGK